MYRPAARRRPLRRRRRRSGGRDRRSVARRAATGHARVHRAARDRAAGRPASRARPPPGLRRRRSRRRSRRTGCPGCRRPPPHGLPRLRAHRAATAVAGSAGPYAGQPAGTRGRRSAWYPPGYAARPDRRRWSRRPVPASAAGSTRCGGALRRGWRQLVPIMLLTQVLPAAVHLGALPRAGPDRRSGPPGPIDGARRCRTASSTDFCVILLGRAGRRQPRWSACVQAVGLGRRHLGDHPAGGR